MKPLQTILNQRTYRLLHGTTAYEIVLLTSRQRRVSKGSITLIYISMVHDRHTFSEPTSLACWCCRIYWPSGTYQKLQQVIDLRSFSRMKLGSIRSKKPTSICLSEPWRINSFAATQRSSRCRRQHSHTCQESVEAELQDIPDYTDQVMFLRLSQVEKAMYRAAKARNESDVHLRQLCCHLQINRDDIVRVSSGKGS